MAAPQKISEEQRLEVMNSINSMSPEEILQRISLAVSMPEMSINVILLLVVSYFGATESDVLEALGDYPHTQEVMGMIFEESKNGKIIRHENRNSHPVVAYEFKELATKLLGEPVSKSNCADPLS